jgi:hypothetical protein
VPIKILLPLALTVAIILGGHQSWAMSCYKQEKTLEESNSYLGKEKFSPFSAMKWTSLIGNIAGVTALARYRKDNQEESDIPQWVVTGGVVLWSTSALLMMVEGGCPVKLHPDANSDEIAFSDEIGESLKTQRATFWFMHAINSLPLILATPYSSHDDRAYILAGGILLPAVIDIVIRSTFYREKVSPWSLRPGLVSIDSKLSGQLALSYHW